MGRHKKETIEKIDSINVNLIRETVNILSETKNKITLLNEGSAKEFSTYYGNLRKVFLQIKSISDISINMGNLLKNSKINEVSKEIIDFQDFLTQKSESFNARYKNHIQLLEEINNTISQLYIPLKEYKQNIASLKLIITNFKIDASYQQKPKDNEDSNIAIIETLIAKMYSIFPLIDESLMKLKIKSDSLKNQVFETNKKNLIDFSNIIYKIAINNMEIVGMVDEKTSQVPGLYEKTEQCFLIVDKIINKLQYEDIIKQKIDHIQNIHKEVIAQLKAADNADELYINLAEYKLASNIPSVAELQVAQLIYTNQEYQDTIESIFNKFVEIADLMLSYVDHNNQFSNSFLRLDKGIMNDLSLKSAEIKNIVEAYLSFKKQYTSDLLSIDKLSDEIYENFTSLNAINANIDQQAFYIIKKQLHHSEQKGATAFAKQIETISTDVNKTLHNFQHLFTIIQKNTKHLVLSIDNTRADALMHKRNKDFLQTITKFFNEIAIEHPIIMELIQKNISLCQQASDEINASIQGKENSVFYEKTIEEIIKGLNYIYKQFKLENIDIDRFKRDLTPKYLANLNISHSERVINNYTLNKLKGRTVINSNFFFKSKRDKGVELF